MGRKKRQMVSKRQKLRRRKRLKKLREKNLNIKEYFFDGHYIGPKAEK